MNKHIFLNPFYWYAVIWSSVLVLYPLNWAEAYPPLSVGVRVFFYLTILASLVAGCLFGKYLKRIYTVYHPPKNVLFCFLCILAGYALDFIHAQHIPLIDELKHSEYTYKDFAAMPVVHMLVVTFSMFYGAYMFYCFLSEHKTKYKLAYAGVLLTILLMLLCLYNRGALLMMVFMCGLLFLATRKKIRARYIVAGLVIGLLVLYLFGIMGNIRSGSPWNDTSYIIEIAQVNVDKIPSFLPKPFIWAYVYLVSPLGNLNNFIINYEPTGSILGLLACIVPDYFSMRIFPKVDTGIPLVIEYLTVSSGFAGVCKSGGYLGMIILFTYMVILVSTLIRLSIYKPQLIMTVCAMSCVITAFLFFDNFVNYAGFVFSFCFPMALVLISRLRDKFFIKKKKRSFFQMVLPCVKAPLYKGPHD